MVKSCILMLAVYAATASSSAAADDELFFDGFQLALPAINEIVTDGPESDAVEFFNRSFATADLSGWYFTDSQATVRYTFTAGTLLPGRAFLVVNALPFGLSTSDAVILRTPQDVLFQSFSWSSHPVQGGSYSRCPDGVGSFLSVAPTTLGAENACP